FAYAIAYAFASGRLGVWARRAGQGGVVLSLGRPQLAGGLPGLFGPVGRLRPLVLEAVVSSPAVAADRELVRNRLPAGPDAWRNQLQPLHVVRQGPLLPLDDQQGDVVAPFLGGPA
ncbi:MAG: hypothetical protein ACK55I_41865, partial [bacterium]